MFRRILLMSLVLALCACSLSQQSPTAQRRELALKNRNFDNAVIRAQTLEKMGEYEAARDEFLALFKEYKSPALLENAYMLTLMNDLGGVDEINELSKPYLKENAQIARYSAVYHMQKSEFSEAERILKDLEAWNKDFRNYELLGDLYLQRQNFKAALANYEKSAADLDEINEILTLKIAETQLMLNQQSAAKSRLEAYVDEAGCTFRVCLLLGKIYINENDGTRLEALHIKLYELTKNPNFIRALLENFIAEKKYKEALQLALKYELSEEKDEEILFFLYEKNEKFGEAKDYALGLYEQKQDKKYMLIAAVMEFEDAMRGGKVSKSTLSSVSKKFEQGLDDTSAALYLNYYGYLLIDYDLDIAKGINLVQRALRQEPNNLFYLDSLSWGYYKQGQCSDAWNVMLKTMHDKDFSSSKESQEHIKAIQRCMSEAKK